METSGSFVTGAVFILVLATAGLAGCADDGGLGSNVDTCEDGVGMQQPGNWGGISCEEASGPATLTDTFDCQTPEESAIGGTLMQGQQGSLQISVEDASGEVVFEEEYSAGEHPVGSFIGEGEAGEWTVTVQLSDDWESGQFGIGAGCNDQSTGGGGDGGGEGGSGSQGCQTNSDVRSGGMSFGQIRCSDKQGADTHEATFQCENPSRGSLTWNPEMESGEVTATILDANGDTVLEETFNGTSRGGVPLEDGATGEWTFQTERSPDFEGTFYSQAACGVE